MSKGNPVVHVRFDALAMKEMQDEYIRWEENGQQEKRSLSDYIRQAVLEKISHAKRSRAKRNPGKCASAECLRLLVSKVNELKNKVMNFQVDEDCCEIDHG